MLHSDSLVKSGLGTSPTASRQVGAQCIQCPPWRSGIRFGLRTPPSREGPTCRTPRDQGSNCGDASRPGAPDMASHQSAGKKADLARRENDETLVTSKIPIADLVVVRKARPIATVAMTTPFMSLLK